MEEAVKWMERAEKDLSDAEFNLANERLEVAAFLSHQTAEKALKAVFILKFKRLWKIHDLKQLGDKVEAPNNILVVCDELNPHYIETRYPVDFIYAKKDVEKAINNAKKVLEWTKKKIKE